MAAARGGLKLGTVLVSRTRRRLCHSNRVGSWKSVFQARFERLIEGFLPFRLLVLVVAPAGFIGIRTLAPRPSLCAAMRSVDHASHPEICGRSRDGLLAVAPGKWVNGFPDAPFRYRKGQSEELCAIKDAKTRTRRT